MMFNFFQNSLRKRLFTAFIGIGLVPFLTLLAYILYLSQTKIAEKLVVEQLEKTKVIVKRIDSHLDRLRKEVLFLSSLDLMDDLLAEDIDKRVSRLLSKKADDLDLDIVFVVLSPDATVIASSDKTYLLKKEPAIKTDNSPNSYVEQNYLYIYADIHASFDNNKKLGVLVLKYNLANLNHFLIQKNGFHSYLVDPEKSLYIGNSISYPINLDKNTNSLIDDDHLIVYEKLLSMLDGWYIVYAVDKNIALGFLYDFVRFMFYISPLIIVLVLYLSITYAKAIVRPIEELTEITDNITNTHNYSTRLHLISHDEIGTLTRSFNTMLTTTSNALQKLEEENRLRLKRFTQLIELFNTIIQTKTEKECIEISIQEIKKLTGQQKLHFHKGAHSSHNRESAALFVTDFEKEEKVCFGMIELEIEQFDDTNEKEFYHSVAAMIGLQLDRIRLIKKALSASKAKSAFISSMSHELRTPLNAIIGSSQYLLVYESLNDKQQDAVGNIESSAQYLLGMINEILDIAKIEAGKMEVRKEDINLINLLQNSFSILAPLASDKELELRLNTEDFKLDVIHTDPKLLSQIIINLISNAIKFTVKGAIDISLSHDDTNIYIIIKDSGIGIDNKEIKHLFNDFTQIDNELQKSLKGTGLGLSISKKIAQILGGDLILQSEGLGHGTTAIFSLTMSVDA